MVNKLDSCTTCKKLHTNYPDSVFPKPVDIENICSECKVDEAFHAYLRSLRQKEERLTFSEWIFLTLRG